MFESLDDTIRQDEQKASTPRQRYFKWILSGIVAVVVFGGLYMGVRLLE